MGGCNYFGRRPTRRGQGPNSSHRSARLGDAGLLDKSEKPPCAGCGRSADPYSRCGPARRRCGGELITQAKGFIVDVRRDDEHSGDGRRRGGGRRQAILARLSPGPALIQAQPYRYARTQTRAEGTSWAWDPRRRNTSRSVMVNPAQPISAIGRVCGDAEIPSGTARAGSASFARRRPATARLDEVRTRSGLSNRMDLAKRRRRRSRIVAEG